MLISALAVCYFNKVREELTAEGEEGEERFQQFVDVLGAAETTLGGEGGVARLYSQVCAALESHPHLATEFLAFLEPGQALACRRFSEHSQISDMTDLIVKLEVRTHCLAVTG